MRNNLLLLTLPFIFVACSSDSSKDTGVREPVAGVTANKADKPASLPIDEKNGFRNHHFGDNISTFPGLKPLIGYSLPDTKRYEMPKAQENLKVGEAKLSSIVYTFHKDKFYEVMASVDMGDDTSYEKLSAAAVALYGQGKEFSSGTGVGWYGEKVNGAISIENSAGHRFGRFHLTSKTIEKQMEEAKTKAGKKASADL